MLKEVRFQFAVVVALLKLYRFLSEQYLFDYHWALVEELKDWAEHCQCLVVQSCKSSTK